jgi:hypothetical protein
MANSTRDFAEKATWDEMAKKLLAQHYDRKSATPSPAFDEDGHRCQRSLQ